MKNAFGIVLNQSGDGFGQIDRVRRGSPLVVNDGKVFLLFCLTKNEGDKVISVFPKEPLGSNDQPIFSQFMDILFPLPF